MVALFSARALNSYSARGLLSGPRCARRVSPHSPALREARQLARFPRGIGGKTHACALQSVVKVSESSNLAVKPTRIIVFVRECVFLLF